jgi:DNA-binding response OmpR family regulator
MKTTAKKILIVEDDKSIVYSLVNKFNLSKGVKATHAEDGKKGLSMALKEKPDLILLDIILPKMDGVKMLQALRQDDWGKDAKVIVLSNLYNPDKERELKELGIIDYIIKADWKIEDVVEKTRKVLGL